MKILIILVIILIVKFVRESEELKSSIISAVVAVALVVIVVLTGGRGLNSPYGAIFKINSIDTSIKELGFTSAMILDAERLIFGFNPIMSTEDEYDDVVEALNEGIPLLTGFQIPNMGGHAVNAVRLVRDTNDPNCSYLVYYDNNDNSKLYYFKITKTSNSFWNRMSISNWQENDMYLTKYLHDGQWVDVSLELSTLT